MQKHTDMSYEEDQRFREELLTLICRYGATSHKLLRKFSATWSKDNYGAIKIDEYSITWKYKDEIKKSKNETKS